MRRSRCLGLAAAALVRPARAAANRREFDQPLASLALTAHPLAMFSSTGRFERFEAHG